MKILVDVNLPPAWVDVFARHGIEAVHWASAGDPRAKDREILGWARDNGFVIFTHDLDFGALLALTRSSGPSVVQVRTQDVLPGAIARIVLAVIQEHCAQLERGALVTVDEATSRVRILPIA